MTGNLSSRETDQLTEHWWSVWIGMHWGFRRHAAVYWACHGFISPEKAWDVLRIDTPVSLDTVIFYRELVEDLVPEYNLAQLIAEATPEPERRVIRHIYAGNNAFEHAENSSRTIAELMNERLVASRLPKLRPTDDGPSSRIPSFRMMADAFRRTVSMPRGEAARLHRLGICSCYQATGEVCVFDGEDPEPSPTKTPLLFISADCPKLIATIPALISVDPKVPEDVNRVGTVQDDIFEAAKNTFREYPAIAQSEPYAIRRKRAIDAGLDPMQQRRNMVDFDRKRHTGRRQKRIT